MKNSAFIVMVLTTLVGSLVTAGCGGSETPAKDPSAEQQAAEQDGKKSMKKFEGNRMEKANTEE